MSNDTIHLAIFLTIDVKTKTWSTFFGEKTSYFPLNIVAKNSRKNIRVFVVIIQKKANVCNVVLC